MKVLDEHRAEALERFCEWIVPGSSRVGPVIYVDTAISEMPPEVQSAALEAIDAVATADSSDALTEHQQTPGFAMLRALAIEAFYSDFVAPSSPGPGSWSEIDFVPPLAADLDRDWSYLEIK